MEIRLARLDDVGTYSALAKVAQVWLRSRGLGQFVPAAHDEYAAAIRARVESGTLYAVWLDSVALGFFSLDPVRSPWWPADEVAALYLAGMVVAREARGRGIGRHIIAWCIAEAGRQNCQYVRLDCHASNPWLCEYYDSQGFRLRGRVQQQPGYESCLYERAVSLPVDAPDA